MNNTEQATGEVVSLLTGSDSFQNRILSMLEAAARDLLADHIREREAAARQATLEELIEEVEQVMAAQSQMTKDRETLEVEREAHAQNVEAVRQKVLRAHKRVRKARRVVGRYQRTLEAMREQIEMMLNRLPSGVVSDELEALDQMIARVIYLEPDEDS